MDIDFKRVFLPLMAGLALAVASSIQGAPGKSKAGGWEPSADHVEDIVISVKTNPETDPEAACVALQIGINLMMDDVNGPEPGAVVPADAVTLFLTLDGVNVVGPDSSIEDMVCFTPKGPDTASIRGLLGNFWMMGGDIVVCPLCWAARYPDAEPTLPQIMVDELVDPSSLIGNGTDIHDVFLYADKVIDF